MCVCACYASNLDVLCHLACLTLSVPLYFDDKKGDHFFKIFFFLCENYDLCLPYQVSV